MRSVLVLLPPSETKRDGGDGPPLRLDLLAHPELNPLRAELLDELVKLAGDPVAARAALGLSPQQDREVARNAELWTSPTLPALRRFVEEGGTIVTIGSSTALAQYLGLPVTTALTETGPDGALRPLPNTKFYVPGSVLETSVDNNLPVAYGLPDKDRGRKDRDRGAAGLRRHLRGVGL